MTTFNAGAIEANLTLGRSSWTKDLRLTKKEIADLERTRITVMLDMDADNALIQMSNFEALAEDLDNETYTPKIDVDIAETQAKITELSARLQALDMTEVNPDIDIDVHGYGTTIAQLSTLEAQIGILEGREIDIDVDVDRAALRGLLGSVGGDGSGGHLGLLRILLIAIVALLPILAVMFSTAGAALIGFVGALVAALGPLAILGVGIAGLVMRYKELLDAAQGGDLSGPAGQLQDAIERLTEAWDKFLDMIAPEGFELMADALGLVADVLPEMVPLFEATAEAMGGVLDALRGWINSPEWDAMIDFFMTTGINMLLTFIDIGGDLIRFFGRLFDAMAPFIETMMSGLAGVTEGWADWAAELENNEAFQEWIDNTLEYGPMVLDMLGSLIDAFYNIGQALLPFAGPMLSGLTAFFDFIANMDTDTLSVIVGLFSALYLGAHILMPLLGLIAGGFGVLAGVLTAVSLPMLVVAGLIAGLVAVIIYLWETNEEFREAVIVTWNAIRDTVLPIVSDIRDFIMAHWGPIRAFVMEIWNHIKHIVIDAMVSIRQITRGVTAAIRFIWRHFGDEILAVAKFVWTEVARFIRGIFQIIRGIFQVFRGILTGDWRMMWEGMKNIARGAGNVLNAIFGSVARAFGNALGWMRDRFNQFVGWLGSLGGRVSSAVSGIWDGIGDSFANMLNAIIRMWNNFSLSVNIPDKIPGLPDSFTVNTPDVGYVGLARGAYVTDPMLALIGEGQDNEIVAPEPVLREIVRENSGSEMDYGRLVAAFAAALTTVMGNRDAITREDLLDAIAAAGMKIDIDASGNPSDVVRKIIGGLSFELRRMGFGGKRFA